jgi:hypothetical protein
VSCGSIIHWRFRSCHEDEMMMGCRVPMGHGPWRTETGTHFSPMNRSCRPLIFVCSVRAAIFSIICGAHATHNYSDRASGCGENTNTLNTIFPLVLKNTIFPFIKRQRKCLKIFCWNCPAGCLANHTDC